MRERASGRTAEVAWCFDAVDGVSRTFAITVDVLEEPMASRICVGYLLCRVADTVEDAGHIPASEKAAVLRTYADTLDPASETTVAEFADAVAPWVPADRNADWDVVANADRAVAAFEGLPAADREAMLPPVRELVEGMAEFVARHADTGGLRIHSVEELEEYCWYAAGTVGDLVTNLLVRHTSPEREQVLRENAEDFALLLQLVNVAKDVRDDYESEDNVYLPAEWLAEAGIDQNAVNDPENEAEVADVIERLVGHADGYTDGAQTYLEHLPLKYGNTLAAWAIPYLLAVGTMRELRQRPRDVLRTGDAKVSKAEVFSLIQRFSDGVRRDDLDRLRDDIADSPYTY
ncbi:phytoene/squalene synthase family protein [Salarchaeum sp. III]|uniref:phytoene/squalene synthase family protein n=1 Tax=Salarchaeum sp. III TaxID=3107927 RepID=UPI002ED798AF